MALPRNRLVILPSQITAAAQVGALGMWVALETYLVVFTAPPPEVIVLFSLPVPLFLWRILDLTKTTVLEVDATGIRQTRGRRLVTGLSFQEVGSVEARFDAVLRTPFFNVPVPRISLFKVRDRSGKTRLMFVSGPRVSAQNVQFLYQAIAIRARGLGIPVSPYVELPPELQMPLDEERRAYSEWPSGSALVRFAVAWLAVISVPTLMVRLILPSGGLSAGLLFVVLLLAGVLLVFSPRTRRIREWAMKRLRISKGR